MTKTVQGIGPVEQKDIAKGYPIERDQYVTFTADELDAVRLETKRTLDLSEFVDAAQIDPRYFERPYYIAPADEYAAEGYLVIHEALKRMGKLGIGQVAMSGREHLVAVGPISKAESSHCRATKESNLRPRRLFDAREALFANQSCATTTRRMLFTQPMALAGSLSPMRSSGPIRPQLSLLDLQKCVRRKSYDTHLVAAIVAGRVSTPRERAPSRRLCPWKPI
jgi:hypothetical protein